MIIDLSLIQLIIVFIVDVSGAIDSFKSLISKLLTKGRIDSTSFSLKPFDCSLCMTWWTCLVYLIVTHSFTLPFIAFAAALAYLTPVTYSILLFIRDSVLYLINLNYKWLK